MGGVDWEGRLKLVEYVPLLLHRLAPTAPLNAEGTCSTCKEGIWNLGFQFLNAIVVELVV